MRHVITPANFQEAEDAMRDILFMYYEAIEDGSLIMHASTGSFDALRFLDAADSKPSLLAEAQLRLLHEGSAVSILKRIADRRDEDVAAFTLDAFCGFTGQQLHDALEGGRFDHLPLAKAAIMAGFSPTYSQPFDVPRDLDLFMEDQQTNFWPCVQKVYESYVVGYYQRMLAQARL